MVSDRIIKKRGGRMEKPNVYVKKGVLFIGNVMGSMRKAVGCEEKEVCLLGMVVRRVKKSLFD